MEWGKVQESMCIKFPTTASSNQTNKKHRTTMPYLLTLIALFCDDDDISKTRIKVNII